MLAMSSAHMLRIFSAATRLFFPLLILLFFVQGVLVGDGFAQAIDPAVRSAAAAGPVRVIVELRITPAFTPEGELPSPAAVDAQRRAISQAQDDLIASLAGTSFSVVAVSLKKKIMAREISAHSI